MKLMIRTLFFAGLLWLMSCRKEPTEMNDLPEVSYKYVNRSVVQSDVHPVALDINEDGVVDFTVFAVLTASNGADHLYMGVNPIGWHEVHVDPSFQHNFYNSFMAISFPVGSAINGVVSPGRDWQKENGIIAIRTTSNSGITYSGQWSDQQEKMVGFKLIVGDKINFGWIRLRFNKVKESVTVVDYAWNTKYDETIIAGSR